MVVGTHAVRRTAGPTENTTQDSAISGADNEGRTTEMAKINNGTANAGPTTTTAARQSGEPTPLPWWIRNHPHDPVIADAKTLPTAPEPKAHAGS